VLNDLGQRRPRRDRLGDGELVSRMGVDLGGDQLRLLLRQGAIAEAFLDETAMPADDNGAVLFLKDGMLAVVRAAIAAEAELERRG
jgi:hypothetical protein